MSVVLYDNWPQLSAIRRRHFEGQVVVWLLLLPVRLLKRSFSVKIRCRSKVASFKLQRMQRDRHHHLLDDDNNANHRSNKSLTNTHSKVQLSSVEGFCLSLSLSQVEFEHDAMRWLKFIKASC